MNLEYVFIAYALIIAALFLYIASLTRRQRRIEREIELLRRVVEGGRD